MPQARDIMVTDWLLVDKGQEVGKVVEKAREKRFQVIPIVSEKKLIGVVTYRDLLIRRIPPRTRVDKVMEPPFYINQREDIISIISKFLKWRVKAIPVVDDSMKYLGMISRNVLINGFKAQLKGKVKEYMSSPAIYIEEEESVARARWVMIRNSVTRLPVLKGGKLHGIISMSDIVERLYFIVSGKKKESIIGEEEEFLAIPVREIMVSPPIISQDEEDLSAVAFKILNNNISGTPVISSDRLIGVISSLDLLKAIAKELQVVEPLQVKVKAKIEDSTKLSMERMINYSISRLNRFTEVLNISTSIKEYSDKVEGGRTKFDIHVKVVTPRGTLVAEGIAWDPLGALREALKKIERRLIKETGRKRTKVLKTKRYKDEGFREG